MAKAEQAILAEREDALQATVIVDKLKQLRDQAVELKRQGKMDASSVQGEVDKLKAEIARLVWPRRAAHSMRCTRVFGIGRLGSNTPRGSCSWCPGRPSTMLRCAIRCRRYSRIGSRICGSQPRDSRGPRTSRGSWRTPGSISSRCGRCSTRSYVLGAEVQKHPSR